MSYNAGKTDLSNNLNLIKLSHELIKLYKLKKAKNK